LKKISFKNTNEVAIKVTFYTLNCIRYLFRYYIVLFFIKDYYFDDYIIPCFLCFINFFIY
jgi:hypothetical protein